MSQEVTLAVKGGMRLHQVARIYLNTPLLWIRSQVIPILGVTCLCGDLPFYAEMRR